MKRLPLNLLIPRALLFGSLLSVSLAAGAAEFVGKVSLTGPAQTLSAQAATRIGVALFPLEGQKLPRRARREFTIKVSNLRLNPNYIVANPGDQVRFVNLDSDYFKLFSPSEHQSFEILLGPVEQDNEAAIDLAQFDAMHVFCRIHAGTYGRIDVLNTPLTRIVEPDEAFEFRDLQPGRWLLRISAPGTETREVEVLAMTAPPVRIVELESLMMAHAGSGVMQERIGVEDLFPASPGY